jgi:hypothetical protein
LKGQCPLVPNRVSSKHRYSLKYAATFCVAVLVGFVSSVIAGAFMSPVPHKRAEECPEALPLGFQKMYLCFWCPQNGQEFYVLEVLFHCLFFLVENCEGIPVPVEKNRGSRNPRSVTESSYGDVFFWFLPPRTSGRTWW